MTLESCLDLQLILLAIFVISLIVLMEQVGEYFYFKKDSSMKIKIFRFVSPNSLMGIDFRVLRMK